MMLAMMCLRMTFLSTLYYSWIQDGDKSAGTEDAEA